MRRQLQADAETAVLRNIANSTGRCARILEQEFRRFECALSEQLGSALLATRQAMHIAIERRTARAEEMKQYVEESRFYRVAVRYFR